MRSEFRQMWLIGILIISFILRFYKVADIPPALSWDEVSIGYNAYSILMTGKDEHGRYLPLDTFIGYGDYKPPIAIYATVPFVAIFGLIELAVRLPSVVFGSATIALIYLLVKEQFLKEKFAHTLALLSAFLVGISPWHIQISRGGFEANIALFFVCLGIYVLTVSKRKTNLLAFSLIPFVMAVYTFNSARYFVPFLTVGLLIFGWNYYRQNLRNLFIGLTICIILLIPIIPHLLSKEAQLRFQEVNIFTDPQIVVTANQRIEYDGGLWWAKILHNRRIGYARSYLLHFFDHFQPNYLFIRGDGNPKFSTQETGQLYLLEAPFLIIGIIFLIRNHKVFGFFLLYWLISAIIPAAVARETPHALRTLNSLPVWYIFIAYGLLYILRQINQWLKQVLYKVALVMLYGISLLYFAHNYLFHYAKEYSQDWQFGYRQAISAIIPLTSKYDKIIIDDYLGRSYMYTLFYSKTDPKEFLAKKSAYYDWAGFYHVDGFGKYKFPEKLINTSELHTLYVIRPDLVPPNARIISEANRLNGSKAFVIYDNL